MLQEAFTMREGGFTKTDYVVFCVLCLLSCAGGLWYSVTGATTQSVENVKKNLLGNKSLSTVPVALSLIASYISVLTILATPAEVYNYGAQYWLVIVGVALSCFIVCVVYLPVFFTLRLSTSYEYLEVRFNRHVRAVASFLFLFDEIMFLPMVVYIPVLAFNQLTGYNIYAIGTIMVVACGIYTALGGLKAIIWTHSAQTTLMFTGLTIIVIVGTIAVGGVAFIFKTVSVSGRTSLSNWDISPIQRQTGWGAVFGGTIYWTCFNSVNQIMVQRYVALPTKGKAYTAISIFGTGSILTISLCVWCGLTAYGTWVSTGCHPGASPLVDDRLLPAYVTYISTNCGLPGLTGLFVAGIFGAGLSSLSVVLNACALVVIEDMLHGWLQIRLMPLRQGLLARTIIMVLAILSVLMMYVIQKLGGLLGVATAVSAIAASTTCGMFTLGMLCSWVGPRGAVAGAFAGVFVTFSLTVGTQTAGAMGLRALPLGVGAQCPNITSFQNVDGDFDPETILSLFRISYHWVALMGLLTTTIVGAILGKFLDIQDDMKMDAELYSPVVWRFLPAEAHAHSGDTRRARKISLTESQHASPVLRDTGEKVAPDESTSNNNK